MGPSASALWGLDRRDVNLRRGRAVTSSVSTQVGAGASRRMHDELLRSMPAGAMHDAEVCPHCSASDTPDEPEVSVKTYTEDELRSEVDKAVADATGTLQARLSELEGKGAIDAAVAAATDELNARIGELEGQLDAAVLEANTARDAHASVVAWLEAEATTAAQAAEIASRRAERLDAVKEIANFTDGQLEERADRWASMNDVEFAALLDDYRAVTRPDGAGAAPIPTATAMTAAAEPAPVGRTVAIKGALALRGSRTDVSTISN
jgi:hypothetical protein